MYRQSLSSPQNVQCEWLPQIFLMPILSLPVPLYHFPPSTETSLRSRSQMLVICEGSHQASHEKVFLSSRPWPWKNLLNFIYKTTAGLCQAKQKAFLNWSIGIRHWDSFVLWKWSRVAILSVSTAHVHVLQGTWCTSCALPDSCSPTYFSASSSGHMKEVSGTLVNTSQQLCSLQISKKSHNFEFQRGQMMSRKSSSMRCTSKKLNLGAEREHNNAPSLYWYKEESLSYWILWQEL